KFRVITGVGLAHPNSTPPRKMKSVSAGYSRVPIGSMWYIGFSVTRPCNRAVWSPSREAIHAWAHSCTLSEKISSTNLNKAMRRKVCDTSAPKYRKPQVTIRSFFAVPLSLLSREVPKDRVRLNLLPGEHN